MIAVEVIAVEAITVEMLLRQLFILSIDDCC